MNAPGNEMDHDLRTRVVSLEHGFTATNQRVSDLEKWQRQTEIADAATAVEYKEMNKKLNRIDTTISRLNWLVISGLIMGILGFIVKGGLNLP